MRGWNQKCLWGVFQHLSPAWQVRSDSEVIQRGISRSLQGGWKSRLPINHRSRNAGEIIAIQIHGFFFGMKICIKTKRWKKAFNHSEWFRYSEFKKVKNSIDDKGFFSAPNDFIISSFIILNFAHHNLIILLLSHRHFILFPVHFIFNFIIKYQFLFSKTCWCLNSQDFSDFTIQNI